MGKKSALPMGSFSLFDHFCSQLATNKYCLWKQLMAEFEPEYLEVRSNRSANCATTTALIDFSSKCAISDRCFRDTSNIDWF